MSDNSETKDRDPLIEIETSTEGNLAVIALSGKLSVQSSPKLANAIGALPESVCELIIDLSRVDYLASAGIRVLVAADKLMAKRGGRMCLLHPRDEIWEVLFMTGLSEVLKVER